MTELDDSSQGIWTFHHHLRVMGADIGTRMTVIRLDRDALVLHSPIRLTPEIKHRIDAFGTVAHVLAPNADHYFFVPEWKAAYPTARYWAAAGVAEKLPALPFDEILSPPRLPTAWEPVLTARYFRSSATFCELVLLHRPTRTLVSADLSFNIQESARLLSKVLLTLNDSYRSFGPSRMCRRLITDPSMARADLDAILTWEPERLVVAHGDIVLQGAAEKLECAYRWLDDRLHSRP